MLCVLIIGVFMVCALKICAPTTHFKERRKPKKEKRKLSKWLARKGWQGFLKKYYPTAEGGDFFKNP